MAKWIEWTPEQQRAWDDWMATRPQVIKDLVAKHGFSGDKLYRLKTSDHRVTLCSFDEDGTLTVNVTQDFNPEKLVIFSRSVFGVDPNNLEECSWDGPVEQGNNDLLDEEAQANATTNTLQ